jgi:protoporphyrinogen oxidase
MEYFCNQDDPLWRMPDRDLVEFAARELERVGLGRAADVVEGVVLRQRKAYPVYDAAYRTHLHTIRQYLDRITNLQTIGRNGMHRYNNQDNSVLVGLLAAENVDGAGHDLWDLNTDRSYYEEAVINPD